MKEFMSGKFVDVIMSHMSPKIWSMPDLVMGPIHGSKNNTNESNAEVLSSLAKRKRQEVIVEDEFSEQISQDRPIVGGSAVCLLDEEDLEHIDCNSHSTERWIEHKDILYKRTGKNLNKNNNWKMIGFDFDNTLVRTKNGKNFDSTINGWDFKFMNIKKKLKELHDEGHYICIISNQAGVAANYLTKDTLKAKLDKVLKDIGVPVDIICCLAESNKPNIFRKPCTGMWEFLMFFYCKTLARKRALYVGDMAGKFTIFFLLDLCSSRLSEFYILFS